MKMSDNAWLLKEKLSTNL